MPEGHTLHRLARRHRRLFGGQPVSLSSPQGRFHAEATRLDGATFVGAEVWGKHLVHRYDTGRINTAGTNTVRLNAAGVSTAGVNTAGREALVHVHLGLYGVFTEFALPAPSPVGQVRMRIVGESAGVDLRGPTRCELIDAEQLDALVSRLGPDPLRSDADPEQVWRAVHASRRPIGSLLMDQKVVAGIGNVYRAEMLYRAGIDPQRPGRAVQRDEFDEMWADIVALMKVGVRRGKMHVVRPQDDHGAPAYAPGRPRTYVYRRAGEPCRSCGTTISRTELEGRNLYWCNGCQS